MEIPKDINFLVVDDLASIREMLTKNLRNLQFVGAIYTAEGVREATKVLEEKFSEGEKPVDFVITDWLMPDLGGSDLLLILKDDPRFKEIPTLVITTENKRETVLSGIQAGANSYLLKPWTQETLIEKLQKAWAHAKK